MLAQYVQCTVYTCIRNAIGNLKKQKLCGKHMLLTSENWKTENENYFLLKFSIEFIYDNDTLEWMSV